MDNLKSLRRFSAEGWRHLRVMLACIAPPNIRKAYTKAKTAQASAAGRFFYSRPALKRGLLVFAIQQLVLLPLMVLAGNSSLVLIDMFAGLLSLQWTVFLLGLFWGMGAERAAVDWDSVFALPPVGSFDFWRWHNLERRRFMAVLTALAFGLLAASFVGAL